MADGDHDFWDLLESSKRPTSQAPKAAPKAKANRGPSPSGELWIAARRHLREAVSHWRSMVARTGMDREDVVSALLIVWAERQMGEFPFDPSRASHRRYCYLLTWSWLTNRLEQHRSWAIGRAGYAASESPRVAYLDEDAIAEREQAQADEETLFGGPVDMPEVEVQGTGGHR